MAYTYDDFQKAASGSNVNFSQYDLDLAKKYPEFGMSVLDLKKQYAGATTAEQRALINAKANQLRSSYGNYTAGADGSQYVSDGKYAPKIDETLDKIGSFGSFSYKDAPTYENRYQQKQQELLDAALNRDPFSWSKETDPQYGSYKKTYLREGERATANALAQASAASGGRPSSYAVSAATQAGDYYATKLSDVIPTLYQQAYERYLKDYQMKLSDLNAVNQQEQLDYAKYLDRLNQFNTDRNFDYNNYLGEYGRLQDYLGNLQGQDNTEYNRYLGVLDEIREKQQQDQELGRSQVDAMLRRRARGSSARAGTRASTFRRSRITTSSRRRRPRRRRAAEAAEPRGGPAGRAAEIRPTATKAGSTIRAFSRQRKRAAIPRAGSRRRQTIRSSASPRRAGCIQTMKRGWKTAACRTAVRRWHRGRSLRCCLASTRRSRTARASAFFRRSTRPGR